MQYSANILFSVASSIASKVANKGKEKHVLFNDTLNTFYLRLYGVRHMVKDHSDSERKPAAAIWDTSSN